MIRLLVVDDYSPVREQAVKELATDGVIQVVGEAETSDEAYKVAAQLLPDMVLLDLHLPGLMTTNDLIKKLNALKNVKVVIYAGEAKAAQVPDLLDAGAYAYLLKSDPAALVRMTLLMISRGSKNVISPQLPRNLLRLSVQERNILREVTKRGGLPKAAERMGITEYDLHQILDHLVEKLELNSPEHLVRWAKKNGF